jgi:hypothetical protein
MSFLALKVELENTIQAMLDSYKERMAKLDETLDFKLESEDETMARLYMSVNGPTLHLRPVSAALQGDDLNRFISYMELVKTEIDVYIEMSKNI